MSIRYQRVIEKTIKADIAVFGAGPAGMAAAVTAARQNKKVVLIEQSGCLGGMGTLGLVPAFMPAGDGSKVLCEGFGTEVISRMVDDETIKERFLKGERFVIPINPEKLKTVYDEIALESNVDVRLFSKAIDVLTEGKRIKGVIAAENDDLLFIKAKQYIDATGDGTISFYAGAEYELGDEKSNTMPPTLCFVLSGVDYDKYIDTTDRFKTFLDQAINDNVFTTPDRHVPGPFRWGKNVVGMNCGHMFGADCLSSEGLTQAIIWGRKIANEFTQFYKKYVPGFEKSQLCATANVVGVRESRRIIGEYVLTIEDYLNRANFDDEIGRCNYSVDIHKSDGSSKSFELLVKEMYDTYKIDDYESYGIPLRSLIPKGFQNLLTAGRCISTDKKVQSSIRIMPICFITGQAAGYEAARRIDNGR